MTNKRYDRYREFTKLSDLKRGDIIKHKGGDASTLWVVDKIYGETVTAIASHQITNPPEWLVYREDGEVKDNTADSDKKFLEWLRDRLELVHGESDCSDYMRRFENIIDDMSYDNNSNGGDAYDGPR